MQSLTEVHAFGFDDSSASLLRVFLLSACDLIFMKLLNCGNNQKFVFDFCHLQGFADEGGVKVLEVCLLVTCSMVQSSYAVINNLLTFIVAVQLKCTTTNWHETLQENRAS